MMNGIDDINSKCIDFDMPLEWGIERKREYLEDCLFELRDLMKRMSLKLVDPGLNPTERELIYKFMKDWKKEENQTVVYLQHLAGAKKTSVSDEMMIKAKNYPIEDLIKVERGFALCPFHPDKNPSFYVKNGYGYCFSCHEQADSIKIAMRVKSLSFKESVRYLNG